MNRQADNRDFYFDEDGLLVFTAHFLLNKGSCCGLGCRHCPYNYINVPEPKRTQILATIKSDIKN